uniref:Synaptobrevin n=1 Tax=Parascaris equorum TaxID=6256 RepID=A0A914RDF7_PAREQ
MGELIAVLNRLQNAQRDASTREKETMKAVAAQDKHVSQQEQNFQGATDVRRAVFYQQKARQKKFFLCVFLVLLVAIIALVLYFFAK